MADAAANPTDRRYSVEHQWIKQDADDRYTVGITEFAQHQLGEVVYVELPKVGAHLSAGQPFGIVESVKTASDVFAPVSGEVVEVNDAIVDQPDAINDDPYAAGW